MCGTQTEGPEYESAVMLGSNLGVGDRDAILAANYLCDQYGLDTISTGNVIGFAMECCQKGLLQARDTGGLALTWGDGDLVHKLIKMIALRQGFGSRLAEGVMRLSREIPGSESFAMQVKGLELAAYDPRGVFGQGLSYATAPRGGEHGRGGFMMVEFFMPEVNLYTHEGKAERAARLAEDAGIYDCSSLCSFNFVPVPLVHELVNAAAGTDYTEEGLREVVRRVITLERRFNLREGFTRKDDTLPPRLLNEPLPDGMAEGKKVAGLDIMLSEYYAIRGWDENGVPRD
jgi:aldehyde:ferredoxin oxidoreductase